MVIHFEALAGTLIDYNDHFSLKGGLNALFSVTVLLRVCDMLLFKKVSSIEGCCFYLDGVLVALSEVVADCVHHAVKELYHEQGRDLKICSRLQPAFSTYVLQSHSGPSLSASIWG